MSFEFRGFRFSCRTKYALEKLCRFWTKFIILQIFLQNLSLAVSTTPPKSFHGVTDPALLKSLETPVKQVWQASTVYPGFEDVRSEEDLKLLFNTSLDVDMAHWRAKAPFSMKTFDKFMDHIPQTDCRRIIVIKNNTLYWPLQRGVKMFIDPNYKTCAEPCSPWLRSFEKEFHKFLQLVKFPDVIFHFSSRDWATCLKPGGTSYRRRNGGERIEDCELPVFSFQKSTVYHDILVPILDDIHQPLYIFPWEQKVNKLFMRASAHCATPDGHQHFVMCSRTYFTRLARYNAKYAKVLEAGLVSGYGEATTGNPGEFDPDSLKDGPLPASGNFPFKDHARYKYLLDTDGMGVSYRGSKLLHINSPVFKMETPYFEWFGRALKDGVHYISYWKDSQDDIFDILEKYRHNETLLQEISMAGMRFAYKYTSPAARMYYWRRVLTEYKALFKPGSMDAYIQRLEIP